MKKTIGIGMFALMILSSIAMAQEYEPTIDKIGSTSQRFAEWVNLNLLTFNKVSKAKVNLEYAERRAIEGGILQEVIDNKKKQNVDYYEDSVKSFDIDKERRNYENNAEKIRTESQGEQKARIEENFQKHIAVLERVRAKLMAKNVTTQGIDQALLQTKKGR